MCRLFVLHGLVSPNWLKRLERVPFTIDKPEISTGETLTYLFEKSTLAWNKTS